MKDVTVLVPTYNHASVLLYQLRSLVTQSNPPKRIVVLDDGSTDDTSAVLDQFRLNPAIKIISLEKNKGVHAAHIRLLEEVDTPYFSFAAADDVLAIDWCETMSSLLEQYPASKIAVSNSYIFDNGNLSKTDAIFLSDSEINGIKTPAQFSKQLLRYGRFPPSNTIMYRSDIISELVRPVFSRTDLRSLTDILLILAIATKYPLACTNKTTGVSIKANGGYGNSFYDKSFLLQMEETIWNFSIRDGFITSKEVVKFLISYTRYSWARQSSRIKVAHTCLENSGFRCWLLRVQSSLGALLSFVTTGRYQYVKWYPRRKEVGIAVEFLASIDSSVRGRFSLH